MAARLALFAALSAFASLVSVSADGLSLKVTGPAQVDGVSDLRLTTTLENTAKEGTTSVSFDPQCTRAQRAMVLGAIPVAKEYVKGAADWFKRGHPANSPRFNTWFGRLDQPKGDRVHNIFNLLNRAGTFDVGWTYTCNCEPCPDKRTTACVNDRQYGLVHLCQKFWTAPLRANDTSEYSKGGTLVHEATHYKGIGGTIDHEYGREDCKDLAKDDPAEALGNADSYMFFAENTPNLG